MNILYLHGLDSKLNTEKRTVLEQYGRVFAPDLDYYNNPNTIEWVLEQFSDTEINTVIGSSMGGFAAYHISNALFRPALLFNPALRKRSVHQNLPADINAYNNLKQIVIAQRDQVVLPADTLSFLSENFNPVTDIYLRLVPRLEHRISEALFKEEVDSFFEKLCF